MSNIINFSARAFKKDENCNSTVCERAFVTDISGNNVECYKLGDWNWSWSQLRADVELEPETDFVFRFAVKGGICNTGDQQLKFSVVFDDDWDNRYTYDISKSGYKPVISKADTDSMLRVFEIPFNSGKAERISFFFTAVHAKAMIMPALENSAYEQMKDDTYAQWWERLCNEEKDKHHFGELNLCGSNISSELFDRITELSEKGCNVDLSGSFIG